MKFDELYDPDCARCGAKKLSAYSTRCASDGEVKEVVCLACDAAERLVRWKETGRLTSQLTMVASLKAYRSQNGESCNPGWLDVNAAYERVRARVKASDGFERAVWFGGLQTAVRATDLRALSADIATPSGTLTLMTYCCAGRCLVQMERGDDRVTLIAAEDESEPRMGIQGIDATEASALALLTEAQRAWCEGAVTMASAPNAGLG